MALRGHLGEDLGRHFGGILWDHVGGSAVALWGYLGVDLGAHFVALGATILEARQWLCGVLLRPPHPSPHP